ADLQALVDSLPDPIFLIDPAERIALVNSAAAKLVQVKPPQALGQNFVSVVSDESILELYEAVSSAQSSVIAPVHRDIRLSRGGQRSTFQAVGMRARAGGVLLVLRN